MFEGRKSASTGSTNSERQAMYRCIACNRPRSSTYHRRHPPEEPPPPQGMCRRCLAKEHLPTGPATVIYEIHLYHHDYTSEHQPHTSVPTELPQTVAYPRCTELPAEDGLGKSFSLNQWLERVPPPVKLSAKPCYERRWEFFWQIVLIINNWIFVRITKHRVHEAHVHNHQIPSCQKREEIALCLPFPTIGVRKRFSVRNHTKKYPTTSLISAIVFKFILGIL